MSAPHEHAWVTASRHATSTGWIRYVRCAVCDTWRVDADAAHAGRPPAAISKEIGAPPQTRGTATPRAPVSRRGAPSPTGP